MIVVGYLMTLGNVNAADPIVLSPQNEDMTPIIRRILDETKDKDVKLVFEKGVYKFLPDYAMGKYLEITNHGNGYKRIIFNFDKFRSVTIEGNGSEFIFQELLFPFRLAMYSVAVTFIIFLKLLLKLP